MEIKPYTGDIPLKACEYYHHHLSFLNADCDHNFVNQDNKYISLKQLTETRNNF